ncbi:hypothetical protein RHOSPDRAFT_35023 [Rhodotorula sp. JG-1b]|nr:hypothetical protein RHOSPDRAFT_35023 [Rhodotorula sp. JG-1b]
MQGLNDCIRALQSKMIPNTGSAARDHLACERTVLAWLRTGMVLATALHIPSWRTALAQLLRLPSTAFGSNSIPVTPTISKRSAVTASVAADPTTLLHALASLSVNVSDPDMQPLLRLLAHQQAQLDVLTQARLQSTPLLSVVDQSRYAHLAKPLGGTFLAVGFVFLLLGIYRYYTVQHALMQEPSRFPPSRRSVGIGAFFIGALVIACFASVMASRNT